MAVRNFLLSDPSCWKQHCERQCSWHDKQGFLKLSFKGMWSMDEWEGRGDAARAEIGPLGGRGRCELAGHLWGPDLLSQDMGMLAPK